MFGWGEPGSLKPPGKENIVNFLQVPYQLECFLMLGLFMCLDAFLYIFTFLPLRVVIGALSLLQELPSYILCLFLDKSYVDSVYARLSILPRFHRTQGFDLMRAAMLCIAVVALYRINMSQAYHFIRGQSMIKLYVLMGMMEVVDKLLCSFGQDVFDALHNATRRAPTSRYTVFYFCISVLYVIVHAIFYFYQVATYMVVVNSADEALVTVLILNNFSELRGFVFKKFDANNLFQCACSDVSERFQIMLFLGIVFLVTLAQQTTPTSSFFAMGCVSCSTFLSAISGHSITRLPSEIATMFLGSAVSAALQQADSQMDSTQSALYVTLLSMMRCMVLMVLGECLSDCVKHAFMNKFNSINASVYEDFAYILRSDLLNYQCDTIVLDHTYSVTRRLGLAQIPLAAVTLRYVLLAISRVSIAWQNANTTASAVPTTASTGLVATFFNALGRNVSFQPSVNSSLWTNWVWGICLVWIGLVGLKVILGVSLAIYADDRQRRDAQFVFHRTPLEVDRLKLSAATPIAQRHVSKTPSKQDNPFSDSGDIAERILTAPEDLSKSLFATVSTSDQDNSKISERDAVKNLEAQFVAEEDGTESIARSTRSKKANKMDKKPKKSVTIEEKEVEIFEESDVRTELNETDHTTLSSTLSTDSMDLPPMGPPDINSGLVDRELAASNDSSESPSPHLQHTQERIDFLEKLATMERYTVYNGRII
jgi:hypothetical protein